MSEDEGPTLAELAATAALNGEAPPAPPPPSGLLVFLDEHGTPQVMLVGEGLPPFSQPTVLRALAARIERALT